MKGDVNPLTAVLDKAADKVEARWNKLAAKYGLALTVIDGGKNALTTWEPADPDTWTPEQMQTFMDTRGEDAVNEYLASYFSAKAEPEAQ